MADIDPLDRLDLLADIEPIDDPEALLRRAEAARVPSWLIQAARRALDAADGVPGALPTDRNPQALQRLLEAVELAEAPQ